MPEIDWSKINPFKRSKEDILSAREAGIIYSFDFGSNKGKYISSVIKSSDPIDAKLLISPKIEVRLAYIFENNEISGVQISKLNSQGSTEKIHLSTLDWDGVLKMLHIFNDMDARAVASGSLILNSSIVDSPEDLEKFLNTVASDPEGKKKFQEVARNFNLLKFGDVERSAVRVKSTEQFQSLLTDNAYFLKYKTDNGIGKDEEVWQKFFQNNEWMLGSDVIEVLGERTIDEDSIVDLPVKSYDGFLDIIELKLPSSPFWTKEISPTSELTKAIMQCMRYITEYDRRFNDHKKITELGVDILKPRITLIYGRSEGWDDACKKQFRILNSSFHNIAILTFDHVLSRSKQMTGI